MVARYFGGLKVEDWNRERPSIEIPIRLDQEITLPELDGDVSLAARSLPLALHISALTVLEDRVVLSLALEEAPPFGEGPLGGPAPLELTSELRSRAERSVRDLYQHHRVAAERERLLGRVRALASHDPLWQGLVGSSSDVVVLAPKRVLQTLCDRVAQGYLQGALLDFDPDLRAHLDEQVKVTVLGKKAGAGRIFGDLSVTHLRGLLRVSGNPQLTLMPPDALDFATPVRVLRGQGSVRLDMHWDPSFLVAIVCRGFAFQENLTGDVLPFSHLVHARIRFAESGSGIVGQPVVRRDRFAVPCDFTPSSIRKVRDALKEQDKFFRCGIAINQDSLLTKVRQLVRNDVHIRLPKALFKPFALPVSLQGEYEAGGFHIYAIAGDPEVAVRPGYLLFGFRAALKVQSTKPITQIIRRAARADTSRPTGDRPGAPSGPGGTKAGGGTD